jgi:hypothetical protein
VTPQTGADARRSSTSNQSDAVVAISSDLSKLDSCYWQSTTQLSPARVQPHVPGDLTYIGVVLPAAVRDVPWGPISSSSSSSSAFARSRSLQRQQSSVSVGFQNETGCTTESWFSSDSKEFLEARKDHSHQEKAFSRCALQILGPSMKAADTERSKFNPTSHPAHDVAL